MCLAIPARIVEVLPGPDELATAEVSGVLRRIHVGLLGSDGVAPGDWVLIHVGFAMARVDEAEARASLALLEQMGAAFAEERQAFEESGIE